MIPRETPDFRIGKVFNKSGWRFYQNAELIFENARVPHANIGGAAGPAMSAGVDKRVRDGIIWTHLAGDSVQRMKVARRLAP